MAAKNFKNRSFVVTGCICFVNVAIAALLIQTVGCISEDIQDQGVITSYQRVTVDKAPQSRLSDTGLESLRPASEPDLPELEVITNAETGANIINLTLEDAVKRAILSSPEINMVSYDPSIAKEDIIKAVSAFDVTLFGTLNYEKEDNPTDSIFLGGQTNARLWESGLKQKGLTGAEWSLAYALTRNWDDLTTRTVPTRYEPMLSFQVKQPLLRNAWEKFNLAGVNISKLNYQIAMVAFRKKTEDVSAEVVSLYWALIQARNNHQIQQRLLDKTVETLKKVEDRKNIDATAVQIKQAEAAVKTRQAVLFQVKKQVVDVQDALLRLLSDSQLNLLEDIEIAPATAPSVTKTKFEQSEVLGLAMVNNPEIQQAQVAVEIARINIDVTSNQKMPKLDLVASTRMQGLSRTQGSAQDELYDGDYVSYALGITFEYPLGNRQRQAELRKRRWEQRKAVSTLHNASDQVAALVKERIRLGQTAYQEIQIQTDAVDAAEIHLQALEDAETIRDKLTPEFLLVKLQAQESLANSQRARIKAIADYNTSLIRLAQATGTVLDMRYIQRALPKVAEPDNETDDKNKVKPADTDENA